MATLFWRTTGNIMFELYLWRASLRLRNRRQIRWLVCLAFVVAGVLLPFVFGVALGQAGRYLITP